MNYQQTKTDKWKTEIQELLLTPDIQYKMRGKKFEKLAKHAIYECCVVDYIAKEEQ